MRNVIFALIRYALYLGLAGSLVDSAIALRKEAFQASRQGLISLKALNGSLMKH